MLPLRRLWQHPASPWLAGAATVAAAAVWLVRTGGTPAKAVVPGVIAAVEVPVRPVGRSAGSNPNRVTVTARWGHPAARLIGTAADAQFTWDGYLSMDCGEIERAEALGVESGAAAGPVLDRVGPVVRGESGDQRIYWRSQTGADWDGVQVQLTTCRGEAAGSASTLRIVTPARTYVANLAAGGDDFVSVPVGKDGNTLDVHIAAIRDFRAVGGARITQAPLGPLDRLAPVAELAPEDVAAAVGLQPT